MGAMFLIAGILCRGVRYCQGLQVALQVETRHQGVVPWPPAVALPRYLLQVLGYLLLVSLGQLPQITMDYQPQSQVMVGH